MSEEGQLEKLEDRHAMLSELEKHLDPKNTTVTEEDKVAAENLRNDLQNLQKSEKDGLPTSKQPDGVFKVLRSVASHHAVFNPAAEAKAFFGERACLARMDIMFEHLKKFIDKVRVAEKFLPGHLVEYGGVRSAAMICYDML